MAAAGIVISASDLDRIRNTLGSTAAATTNMRQKSQELHTMSQARAKTWNNTLEGSRRKKAEEKRKKLEIEELERQKIDAEEAKIQLEKRKFTIDRANKLLHDDSDRIKSFHSKMMMCDVLAEREAQVHLKGELHQLEEIREDRFLEMEKQNYRRMLEREIKEKEIKEELSKMQSKAQMQQRAEFKEKRYQEIEDQMLEGELLRRKGVEDLEQERQNEKKRRGQAIKAQEESTKANDYLIEVRAEEKKRALREMDKIAEYAVHKEKMLQMRKHREVEVFQTKRDQQNRMIDAQSKRLAEMQNTDVERVEKQVAEKEENDNSKRLQKEEMKRRWEDDIFKSRNAQMARRQAQRQRDRAEDAETAKFLGEWCKVLDHQEQEEQDTKRAAAQKLQGEHLKQIAHGSSKGNMGKKQEEMVAAHARKAIEADTVEFHEYAEQAIRDYAAEGKNVIPLIKELRDFRKRAMQ